jgi:hypothetical protein
MVTVVFAARARWALLPEHGLELQLRREVEAAQVEHGGELDVAEVHDALWRARVHIAQAPPQRTDSVSTRPALLMNKWSAKPTCRLHGHFTVAEIPWSS